MEQNQVIRKPHKKCLLVRMDNADITLDSVALPAHRSSSPPLAVVLPHGQMIEQTPTLPIDACRNPVGNLPAVQSVHFHTPMTVAPGSGRSSVVMQRAQKSAAEIQPSLLAHIPPSRKRSLSPSGGDSTAIRYSSPPPPIVLRRGLVIQQVPTLPADAFHYPLVYTPVQFEHFHARATVAMPHAQITATETQQPLLAYMSHIPLSRKRPLSPSVADTATLSSSSLAERATTTTTMPPPAIMPFPKGVWPALIPDDQRPIPSVEQSPPVQAKQMSYSVDMAFSETFGSNCCYQRHLFHFAQGANGSVHLATITKRGDFAGDDDVAVKVVHVPKEVATNGESWERVKNRLKNILLFRHDHLVAYHKLSIMKEPEVLCYELVMDYYSDGDLAKLLTAMTEDSVPSHEATILCYAMQLADGLAFLHRKHIIHGDIKPQNVLVKRTQSSHCVLAIADLDEYIQMQRSITTSGDMCKIKGTFWYMSKEMLKKSVQGESDHLKIGRETDIWSLGCILLDLINSRNGRAGKWLFNPMTGEQRQIGNSEVTPFPLCNLVLTGWVPYISETIPAFFSDCIQKCLADMSANRISASSLLRNLEDQFGMITRQSAETFPGVKECVCMKRSGALQVVHPESESETDNEPDKLENEYYRQGCDCQYQIHHRNSSEFYFGDFGRTRILSSCHFSTNHVVSVRMFRRSYTTPTKLRRLTANALLCGHSQLVSYHKACVFPDHVELMTDNLDQGDNLARLLITRRKQEIPLGQQDVICFAIQIAAGLEYLHHNQLVHGRLCPTVVLVRHREGKHHLLLLDEMQCWQLSEDVDERFALDSSYPLPYQSPERIAVGPLFRSNSGVTVDSKTDVWSLGCIIVEMLNLAVCNSKALWMNNRQTGELYPVDLSDSEKLRQTISTGFKPYIAIHSVPLVLAQSVESCFVVNKAHRISANVLKQQLCEVAEMNNAFPTMAPRSECECLPQNAAAASRPRSQPARDLEPLPPKRQREFVLLFHQYGDDYFARRAGMRHSVYVQLFDPLSGIIRLMLMRKDMLPWNGFNFVKPNREDIVYLSMSRPTHLTNLGSYKLIPISYRFLDQSWTRIFPEGFVPDWDNFSQCAAVDDEFVYYWQEPRSEDESGLKCYSLSAGRVWSLPPHDQEERWSDAILCSHGKNIICCAVSYGAPNDEKWVRSFNTATQEWLRLPDLPEARESYGIVIMGQHLYLTGGRSWNSDTSDYKWDSCWKLDLDMKVPVWVIIKGPSYYRANPGVFVWNNRLYVHGGDPKRFSSEDSQVLDSFANEMEVYSPENDEWSVVDLKNKDNRAIPHARRRTICIPVTWMVADDLDAILEYQKNILGDLL